MKDRIYLDYNATSPLSHSVVDFLRKGDLPFANPASLHQSGKKAKKYINETISYFKDIYQLDSFDLLFHSGATEGINLFIHQIEKDDVFIGFNTDHSAVRASLEFLNSKGVKNYWLDSDEEGSFPLLEVKKIIEESKHKKIFINYTWVNNETGVIWPLEELSLFHAENIFIHVDAVQTVGKIFNFTRISSLPIMYSFSGHKFGALKGVGFSFINKKFKLKPLIRGGSQQNSLRAGTENALGIYSLMLSHKDWVEGFNGKGLLKFKEELISFFKEKIGQDFFLVAENTKDKNLNTIDFIHKKIKADTLLMKFDLAGIDVGSGSACSSGILEGSHVLKAMGLHEFQKNSIRISYSSLEIARMEEIFNCLSKISFH